MSQASTPVRQMGRPREPDALRRSVGPPVPWLAGLSAASCNRPLSRLSRRPPTTSRATGAHHVRPCAVRLALDDLLHGDGARGARHAGLAPSAGRRLAKARRRSARSSPHSRSSPARSGASRCGAPGGYGMRGSPPSSSCSSCISASSRCGARSTTRRGRGARPPSSRWSAPSTFRSSSSRSTGGTRCTSRPGVPARRADHPSELLCR